MESSSALLSESAKISKFAKIYFFAKSSYIVKMFAKQKNVQKIIKYRFLKSP